MKVLAGDWKEGAAVLIVKSQILLSVSVFRSDRYQLNQIRQFDLITDENRASVVSKRGWGAVGTEALIDISSDGSRSDCVFSLVFDDGRKALIKGNAKDAETLSAATYRR